MKDFLCEINGIRAIRFVRLQFRAILRGMYYLRVPGCIYHTNLVEFRYKANTISSRCCYCYNLCANCTNDDGDDDAHDDNVVTGGKNGIVVVDDYQVFLALFDIILLGIQYSISAIVYLKYIKLHVIRNP
uniref:Uncharacterized protein n=1 Tax=Glossina brevipalpis TaxID=37001 RepID=A0A1A9X4I9_9MUSC